ncbi:ribosomal RNA-processing protein [Botrytis cinerea]
MSTDIRDTKLIKELAANDKKTRDAALLSLRTYLSASRSLTPLDYLKIHSGLFYSMWMCDRPLPQQSLANSLASLLPSLSPSTQAPFYTGFWEIMSKEWERIDVLRMEKFLLLVRRYLAAGFEVVVSSSSAPAGKKNKTKASKKVISESGEQVLEVLSSIPCGSGPDAQRTPNGMRFHVIDIWIDELEKLGVIDAAKESEEGAEKLEKLLEPLRKLGKESINKTKESAEGDDVEMSDASEGEEDGWGGIED